MRETVERLERDGLVERGPNPADRRAPLVRLTPDGAAALDHVGPARGLRGGARPRPR
ncbi:winged helix DNA-binding protein [Tsukamurella sp. 1534]|uniref:winged helix DNA-binding protein n=1 Tax=Tsukamurella sp. 1534 TaxID=1151061 RepID=UPI00030C593D|nr:winged helix DNA-binding protein [Tsukamurella sp. 1534]